jgi:hypothetical protein
MSSEFASSLMKMVERIEYWEEILGFKLGEDAMRDDVDEYVKLTFAKELKTPQVMAKILGSKQKE